MKESYELENFCTLDWHHNLALLVTAKSECARLFHATPKKPATRPLQPIRVENASILSTTCILQHPIGKNVTMDANDLDNDDNGDGSDPGKPVTGRKDANKGTPKTTGADKDGKHDRGATQNGHTGMGNSAGLQLMSLN